MKFLEKIKNALFGKQKQEYRKHPEVAKARSVQQEPENPKYSNLPPCPQCGKKRPLSVCGVCNQKFCPVCFDKHRWSHGKSLGYTGKAADYKKE
jgi:hypothetical protein